MSSKYLDILFCYRVVEMNVTHYQKLKFNILWLYRIKVKQATSFLNGLLAPSHLKCKQPRFEEGMHEAKMQVPLFSLTFYFLDFPVSCGLTIRPIIISLCFMKLGQVACPEITVILLHPDI